ncbi:MAG TPA: hypothetical protein VIG06_22230 [Kofleriaceae bacterium]|jgi:hypothetical protein
MRRAALANVIVVSAALALASAGGCTCGSKETKKDDKTPAAEQPSSGGDKTVDPEAMRKRNAAMRNLRLAPLALEDVEPLIPKLPGTTPVGKPGVMTQGRQVKAVLCMQSPSADAAMGELLKALGALGFENIKTRPHPRNQEMITLHGDKQPFQVGAIVQRSRTPDCPGDQGKIKVVLSYFKRVNADAAVPAPGPAPAPAPAPTP